MWRLFIMLVGLLALVYYIMVILQGAGVIQFTNRKLTPGRMFIPFYYWLAKPQEQSKRKKDKLVKPIKQTNENETSSSES